MKSQLTLRHKLAVSGALILFLALSQIVASIVIVGNLRHNVDKLALIYQAALSELNLMGSELYRTSATTAMIALSFADPSTNLNMISAKLDLEQGKAAVQDHTATLQETIGKAPEDELLNELLAQFQTDMETWSGLIDNLIAKSGIKEDYLGAYNDNSLSISFGNLQMNLGGISDLLQEQNTNAYQEIVNQSSQAFSLFAILGTAVVLFLLGTVFIQNRIIVTPMRTLSDHLRSIGTGDADLSFRLPETSHDEIGVACRSFNAFSSGLSSSISAIRLAMAENQRIADSISADASSLSRTVEAINSGSRFIHERMTGLTDRMEGTGQSFAVSKTTIEELESELARQDEQIKATFEISARLSEGISQICAIGERQAQEAHNLSQASQAGGEALRSTVAAVDKINDSAEQILGMLQVIASIAAQTNLLAMNAAIEAAHAGSAGAGFSVVADEIRNLSNSSARQSREITQSVKQIVSVIKTAHGLGRNSLDGYAAVSAAVAGITQSAENATARAQSLTELGTSIHQAGARLLDTNQAVRASMQKIEDAHERLGEAVQAARTISSEVFKGTADIAEAASAVAQAAQAIEPETRTLLEGVDNVNQTLERFTTA